MSIEGKCLAKEPCSDCECKQAEQRVWVVKCVISDKCWNEELKKYIYYDTVNREIVITDNKVYEFDINSYWRIGDMLSEIGKTFDEINIANRYDGVSDKKG